MPTINVAGMNAVQRNAIQKIYEPLLMASPAMSKAMAVKPRHIIMQPI